MPRLPRTEPLLIRRLNALTRRLDGARAGAVEPVHQARVATRRLREALPLLAPGRRRRKLERAVRRLTRALGPVRELDVALQHLDERAGEAVTPALARVRAALVEERQVVHAQAIKAIDRADRETLRRRLRAAAQKSHADGPRARPTLPAATRARAARQAERLRASIDRAAGLYLPDRLHEVRIRVKRLRYALEMVGDSRRAAARGVGGQIRVLKRAQDLLGRMHDLEMLASRARGVEGVLAPDDLRVSVDLDRLVRDLETECRRLHGRYMAMRGRLISVCDRASAAARPARAAA